MLDRRDGLPAFWTTHIAKVLCGDQPCFLPVWLNGHHILPKRPSSASLAKWKAEHTALLQKTTESYKAAGWNCRVESFFKVTGQTAILSGKADLICQQADKRPLIVDVKSGSPKDSDVSQVLIEMIAIPLAWNSTSMIFDGAVVYADVTIPLRPSDAESLKPQVFALLKRLALMSKPDPQPSASACKYCEIPDSLCGQRFEESPQVAATEMF
jgi:hypothetical protein